MQQYDPMLEPDAAGWAALDEAEQVDMVMLYHQEAGHDSPNDYLHATLHVVVENQIVLGAETPVEATLRRLLDENLDRHDAIHAVGSVLARHMFEMMQGTNRRRGNEAYYAELEKLTAEEWLHGDYSETRGE